METNNLKPCFDFKEDNAKMILNEWFAKTKTEFVLNIDSIGNIREPLFRALYKFVILHKNTVIEEYSEAASKKIAQKNAAIKVLNRLSALNLVNIINDSTLLKSLNDRAYRLIFDEQIKEQLFEISKLPASALANNSAERQHKSDLSCGFGFMTEYGHEKQINLQLRKELITKHKDANFKKKLSERRRLPIFMKGPEIVESIHQNRLVMIRASTGSGKTTQVAQYILDNEIFAERGYACKIVVTQPRKIAAISMAKRVAYERDECLLPDVQSSVGYLVRFDAHLPRPFASILFCTAKILLNQLKNSLNGISHLIIDEVHERDENTDLLLIFVRKLIQNNARLRIIIMSATICSDRLTEYFNQGKIIEIENRLHSVTRYYLDAICKEFFPDEDPNEHMKKLINDSGQMLEKYVENIILNIQNKYDTDGAILVFLHGWKQICSLKSKLQIHPIIGDTEKFCIFTLYSKQTIDQNQSVFQAMPPGKRKIILSTNIAETSLTIDDVVFVIDTGLQKSKKFDPSLNSVSFPVDYVSKSNILQRQGRAGRLRSGFLFLLITEKKFKQLNNFPEPEICSEDLVPTCLFLASLEINDIPKFLFEALDPPSTDNINSALQLLSDLNALNTDSRLTSIGRILSKLPADPKVGRMIIIGTILGIGDIILTIAASLNSSVFAFSQYPEEFEQILAHIAQTDPNFGFHHISDHLFSFKIAHRWIMKKSYPIEGWPELDWDAKNFDLVALKYIEKTREQLVKIFHNLGFNPELFRMREEHDDKSLNLARGIMLETYFQNLAVHNSGRHFWIGTDGKTGQMQYPSVFYSSQIQSKNPLSAILFYFEQMIIHGSRAINLKRLTRASFVHLFLFGKFDLQKITYKSFENHYQINDFIDLSIPDDIVEAMLILKTHFENIILQVCNDPSILSGSLFNDSSSVQCKVIQLIKTMGQEDGFQTEIIDKYC